jgi:hypothetical protein
VITTPEDDWLALDLEGAADTANAAASTVDWEKLGAIEREAKELAQASKLSASAITALLARARGCVPSDRGDVLESLEADLRKLG